LEAERLPVGLVALRPTAGRGERNRCVRATASSELERDMAPERVPDEVRCLEARLVHRLLDGVGEPGALAFPSIGGPPACPASVGARTS
jgi:hypothetical protein